MTQTPNSFPDQESNDRPRPVLRSGAVPARRPRLKLLSEAGEQGEIDDPMEYLRKGTLPPDQIARLTEAGITDYVLGTNQSQVLSDKELEGFNGINVRPDDPENRFLIFNKDSSQDDIAAALAGYYSNRWGVEGYKFVGLFPISDKTREKHGIETDGSPTLAGRLAWYNYAEFGNPPDMYIELPEDERRLAGDYLLSPRYIAGFIDLDNIYHPNPDFMAPTSTN